MIIPPQNSHKILLGIAILAQLAGYYFLALSFHYIGIDIKKPPNQVPTNSYPLASYFVYFSSISCFAISSVIAGILKKIEKRLSPYWVSASFAPAILLSIAFILWMIASGIIKVP